MRTYGQFCALAKALDVVGDRWTLLVVRELLIRGPCRYTDLRNGLPGIATNLLADRLRELEQAGLVRSESAPPPVATTLFSLTERGEQLEPALHALGRWGGQLLADATGDEAFRTHWLALPAQLYLMAPKSGPPVTIELRSGDESLVIEAARGRLDMRVGTAKQPDLTLAGPPEPLLAVLLGNLDPTTAAAQGLRVEGDIEALHRVHPPARNVA